MRILILSIAPRQMLGGIATQTDRLIRGFMSHGHETCFVGDTPNCPIEGARYFKLSIPMGANSRQEVSAALQEFRPDVVHVMLIGSQGLSRIADVIKPYPWILGCHSLPPYERIVPFFHGSDHLHYAARSLRYLVNATAWRWLLRGRGIPHVLVHSKFMRDVVSNYGYAKEHITIIPLGHNAPAAPQPNLAPVGSQGGPRLVTVGGIAHTKGQLDTVTALSDIRREFPTARYQIIGEIRDPSYLAFLNRRIRQLGLTDQVHITPNLPHDEKQQALLNADVYIQPSHEEGFCLAYLEAATVVPRLVGADTGAIALMSHGDPGARVVAPGQPRQIADAVRDLLRSALPPNTMRDRAARLGRDFSIANYIDAHERLYFSLMK